MRLALLRAREGAVLAAAGGVPTEQGHGDARGGEVSEGRSPSDHAQTELAQFG